MPKTVELQIEKCRNLVEGMRRHVREMGERGFSKVEINSMELTVSEMESINAEVDRLREELNPMVKKMNEGMARLKKAYANNKKTLKGYYPQERWPEYGIPDRR